MAVPQELLDLFRVPSDHQNRPYDIYLKHEIGLLKSIIGTIPLHHFNLKGEIIGMPVSGDSITLMMGKNPTCYYNTNIDKFPFEVNESTMEFIKSTIEFRSKPEGHEYPYSFKVKNVTVNLNYIPGEIRIHLAFENAGNYYVFKLRATHISQLSSTVKWLTEDLESINYYMEVQYTINSHIEKLNYLIDFDVMHVHRFNYYLELNEKLYRFAYYSDLFDAITGFLINKYYPRDDLLVSTNQAKRAN